ncbi:MAG: thiosulfate oxidation carrier complex protein SoxZ [Acidiferrobacterales bacterium]|nr:thiosulfate oxidation carrier complex protein SoxZ [Acidiferrobacterales bacterium]
MYPTRLKILPRDTGIEAHCEVLHPMYSGKHSEEGGPSANYITQLVFRLNGSIHAEFFLGKFVSKHPVIGTFFENATSGDQIEVSWQDISGNQGQASGTVE